MPAFKRTKPRALADTEIQGEILGNQIIRYIYPANDMPLSAPCGSIIVVDTQDRHLVSGGLYLFQIFIEKNMNSENIYMYCVRRVLSKIGGGVTLYSENPMLAPPEVCQPDSNLNNAIVGRVVRIFARQPDYKELKEGLG